jgi:hypothetical protein
MQGVTRFTYRSRFVWRGTGPPTSIRASFATFPAAVSSSIHTSRSIQERTLNSLSLFLAKRNVAPPSSCEPALRLFA